MKVILLQELKGRGGEGDVVDVANGFANNYLFPQGIAIKATSGNLKQLEMRKHHIEQREEKRLAEAQALKAKLEGEQIRVNAKVGEEGILFGSVTAAMIVDAAKEGLGIELDRKRIELGNPIKVAGKHEVDIHIYRDIKATLIVFVASAEDEQIVETTEEAPAAEEE